MKPLYNKDHDQRVIVGPHGWYIAQKTNHSVGRKADPSAKPPVAHNDPWSPIRRPTPNLLLAIEQAGIK
jgi:hypothetical protein